MVLRAGNYCFPLSQKNVFSKSGNRRFPLVTPPTQSAALSQLAPALFALANFNEYVIICADYRSAG